MFELIYFLLIGLAAGWLAGKIMTGQSFSLVGNLGVGVVGAVLGGFVSLIATCTGWIAGILFAIGIFIWSLGALLDVWR